MVKHTVLAKSSGIYAQLTSVLLRTLASTASPNPTMVQQRQRRPDKKLFTPGPLSCSPSVKEAMLRDLGSRDTEFINSVKFIRNKLLDVAGVTSDRYTAIPLQGSGTYAVEAVLRTSTRPSTGKVLILCNGAYGLRMAKICEIAGINAMTIKFSETERVNLATVETHLKNNAYTTVAIVHCETSSGIINPVSETGKLVKKYLPDASYFVDAMSSFGAIPLNLVTSEVDFLVSSANKCLQGVPGFSYAIAQTKRLLACKGNCESLSLDLVDQYEGLETSGQFRFTPPTHALLAFKQALIEYEEEGGLSGRSKRYQMNKSVLRDGMKQLGFRELLAKDSQGCIITSYHYPTHPNFNFLEFYRRLNDLDQVIYPGKLTNCDCFRIGTIGHLYPDDIRHLLVCIEKVCREMGLPIPVT